MATLVRTKAKHWKAITRRAGWPRFSKTFRTKRDAEDRMVSLGLPISERVLLD